MVVLKGFSTGEWIIYLLIQYQEGRSISQVLTMKSCHTNWLQKLYLLFLLVSFIGQFALNMSGILVQIQVNLHVWWKLALFVKSRDNTCGSCNLWASKTWNISKMLLKMRYEQHHCSLNCWDMTKNWQSVEASQSFRSCHMHTLCSAQKLLL